MVPAQLNKALTITKRPQETVLLPGGVCCFQKLFFTSPLLRSFAPFVALQLRDDNIASHYLSRIVTKGAKNTINVTDTDVLDGYLNFPNRIEQQKIFDFFQKLDDTIALHQRKLAKLKELKKGYLQKMFC